MLNDIDHWLSGLVNGLAGVSLGRDLAVTLLVQTDLVKGVVVMALFWAAWFADPADRLRRARLIAAGGVGCAAIGVGWWLAAALPFRPRPIHSGDPGVVVPLNLDTGVLDGWSSMPSDHAVMFVALATGLTLAHRRLGLVALVHAAVVVLLPRVWLGLHWAGDVVAGAALGAAMALALVPPAARLVAALRLPEAADAAPATFYAALFVVTFIVAGMFDPLREPLSLVRDILALR